MKAYDPFKSQSFFHFTDPRNVPSIRKLGGLYSLRALRARGVEVPRPGGNDWSHKADAQRGLDRYVHLCFRANHPMEYLARKEGRIENSIFLAINPEVYRLDGVMFAPDASNKSGVEILSIEEALDEDLIDFEVLYTKTDWSDPAVKARLQAAQKCELLVPDQIPLKYLRNCPNG
jgi:hypothetical protein